jgi:hypothetical protein
MGKRKKRKTTKESELYASEFGFDDEEDWPEEKTEAQESPILESERDEEEVLQQKQPITDQPTDKVPEEVVTNTDEILLYDSTHILSDGEKIDSKQLITVRIKVLDDQRFKIILKNPYSVVAAHLEGTKTKKQEYRTFRLPIKQIKGSWMLAVQILNKTDKQTIDYKLILK